MTLPSLASWPIVSLVVDMRESRTSKPALTTASAIDAALIVPGSNTTSARSVAKLTAALWIPGAWGRHLLQPCSAGATRHAADRQTDTVSEITLGGRQFTHSGFLKS